MPFVDHREELERQMAEALAEEMGIQFEEALELLGADLDINNINTEERDKWAQRLIALLTPLLSSFFIEAGINFGNEVIAFDEEVLRQRAGEWAQTYTFDLVSRIGNTTVSNLQRLVRTAVEQQWEQAQLTGELEYWFGPVRASLISQTELTRALSAGEDEIVLQLAAQGLDVIAIWETHPELTQTGPCPICAPLDGRKQGDGWFDPPPAHPRCVCTRRFEVESA